MSLDQCHSTIGEVPVKKARAVGNDQIGVDGRTYWRGLEDAADAPEFRDWLEKELPTDASRLLEGSRRTFLKLMGASVALAGAATLPGCRRPDHKIYPYSRSVPEDVVPGKSVYFATSIALPGGAVEGLLVESHEGRPTKLEGNPLHIGSNGKSSATAQASILALYDPDRLKDPRFTANSSKEENEKPRSWEDFGAWMKQNIAGVKVAGVAFVVDKKRSPSRDEMKKRVLETYPKATWVSYDPVQSDEAARGSQLAFGSPMREVLHLEKADVIVSFDRDFLGDDAAMIRNARGFASGRSPLTTTDGMNRLYMVESSLTVTGAKADHRIAAAPSAIPAYAGALAAKLGVGGAKGGEGQMDAEAARFIEELAKDLQAAGRSGKVVVLAGATQPAAVHALCHAMNAALGAAGSTVSYRPMGEDEASSGIAGLKKVVDGLNAGTIGTLVCIGVNPAYDAPGDLRFGEAMVKAAQRITLSADHDETIDLSTWQLPMAHALESWGDLESVEGVFSPVQPMIAPLYAAKSDLEVLAMICGDDLDTADGYEIVRNTWKTRPGFTGAAFDKAWRRGMNDGVFGVADKPEQPSIRAGDVAAAMGAWAPTRVTEDAFDVVFAMGQIGDGRFSNNAWLNELPDPITKVVWDNVALVSENTSRKFGLGQDIETDKKRYAKVIEISVGGQTIRAAAWTIPGIPDNTVVLRFGYGRTKVGRVGDGTGHNVYPISGVAGGSRRMASGARVAPATSGERDYQVVTTQHHGSMEGRAIVREVDLPTWQKFGDQREKNTDSYGNPRDLAFAERLGELSHTPANINAYINPQRGTKTEKIDGTQIEHGSSSYQTGDSTDASGQPRPVDFASRPQWAMSIDLGSCTGCSACTIACQAENNIPVVGKIEVNKGREMHWIRVDRYFAGDSFTGINASSVSFQPVACVHCENAPCETVCPVNATVHGPEGINYMVYNRCIGTRYCANNCPYKVRRFNFFDYGVKKINGDYIGKGSMEAVGAGPKNVNLIPPRLRERLDEITKLGMNPNVTVRSRGVMEKCNYCVQRINEARIEIKLKNLPRGKDVDGGQIPDGFFQVACQQACPSDAITFGDKSDTKQKYPEPGGAQRTGSRVYNLRENARSYMLLGYINTRPRTTHMAGIRNPNPALMDAARLHRMENPFHHGGHEGGHEGESEGGHEGQGNEPVPGKHARGNEFDPAKTITDSGYKLSLAVLGA